ncbi:hypothetical protein [Bacillus sp. 165]|uniref:hypothetical protein n=1 Tax=Bacillus sp. 165 TaxID=1529117 RepID=UPI001ADAFCCF|nr:hypothetical protein [Bacillus sp. 165]MBO9130571.1 hypothetical protein [Bacillus sp. 165]
MSFKWKALSAVLAASLVFTGCAKEEKTDTEAKKTKEPSKAEAKEKEEAKVTEEEVVQAYKDAIVELEKAKEGQEVDFEFVTKLYNDKLQALVQKRDGEFSEQIDQTITAALEAGKNKEMEPMIVKQVFDKLMQKEFFQTIRHEFTEINENWGDKEEVLEEYEEALNFYKAIEGTVGKRDTAYGTNMADAIEGGFNEIKAAIETGDQLAFALGKQVVDKTLMKTFYFATGALPNGYATKAAAAAKTDEKEAKVEQAEGWAFYQTVYPYLNKNASEEAGFILTQFDLQTDVKALDAAAVNKAFVRGFAKVALHEYEESMEDFGEDKGVITALEGALFINMIENDLKTVIGEQETQALVQTAQVYLDAAKAKDKEKAEQHMKNIEEVLNKAIEAAK